MIILGTAQRIRKCRTTFFRSYRSFLTTAALAGILSLQLLASEDAPRKPFAEWADVPLPNQFTIRLWYRESEAYHIWSGGNERQDITVHHSGEDYGIDYTEGIIAMEYGITKKWAADLNIGYGTVGTRSFNPSLESKSTTGLLDSTFGVRYQVFKETDPDVPCPWVPTLTLRAGAIIQGSYDKDFPFAPGNHSAAIEPSVLMKKHFGWPGFGGYADLAYRWMRTSGDDQYLTSIGFFQEIKTWTLNAGWRHVQQISGDDLVFNGKGLPLDYSPQVREIRDAIEAGFSYVIPWHDVKLGFYSSKTIDGSNTSSDFWVSGYVEVPIGGRSK